jgi:hypothetical protein
MTEGEWNVVVRDLTRIYMINERTGRSALYEPTRLHIRNDLLTIDGPPGQEGYNLFECGNQEESTGSPEERAEVDQYRDDLLDDIGDAGIWLLKWLSRLITIVIAAYTAAIIVVQILGIGAGAAIALVATVGGVAVTFGTIPETENHLLMIESDRYLMNQIILAELDPSHPGREHFADAQLEVREWLLKRLQRIAKEDFVEYNSRPYQRYSIYAIRSLYDFADDPNVVLAAQNVLDLASAKMAIGSNQGRRLVPYRRLMDALPDAIEPNFEKHEGTGTRKYFNGLMDLYSGADHQIAAMLMYAGQTQQAPGGSVSNAAAVELIPVATSRYRPPVAVIDLAVNKTHSYQQHFKHDGVEIYSSSPGFLLTGGGVRTGPSSTMEIRGIAGTTPFSRVTDKGAAVPTTLMLSAGANRSSLEHFLLIAGPREQLDSDNATYDHNLCVWRGFACGMDVRTPVDMKPCFNHRPLSAPTNWSFFDSKACPGSDYSNGPHVMIARYVVCRNHLTTCDDAGNVGFFEAITEPGVTFAQFQEAVVRNNAKFTADLADDLSVYGLRGTYRSFNDDRIEFTTLGHQADSDDTGIVSVNGTKPDGRSALGDGASGDIMLGARDTGKFRFTNPNDGHGFSVDMSDWNSPTREDF